MKRIVLFGAGIGAEIIRGCLTDDVEIVGYLDNMSVESVHPKDQKPINRPQNYNRFQFDYIVIASLRYQAIYKQLINLRIAEERILSFFDLEHMHFVEYSDIFNYERSILASYIQNMDVKLKKIQCIMENRLRNLEFEVTDKLSQKDYQFPIIREGEDVIDKIISEHKSLTRLGDGEFEIIMGRERPKFQIPDGELGERLREILRTKDSGILVGIAANYGCLERFEEKCADDIRSYLTPQVRAEHYELLDMKKEYFDAYVTRPYILLKDKAHAGERFERLKKLWENRDVVIVEGFGTRMGYGNDLFANALKIERILCPNENAWSRYHEIREAVQRVDMQKLILISLGPTATVLAYDLYKAGYQAIDIGHIDNEYEWFLRRATTREDIPYKYVNEYDGGNRVEEISSKWYQEQIIQIINT